MPISDCSDSSDSSDSEDLDIDTVYEVETRDLSEENIDQHVISGSAQSLSGGLQIYFVHLFRLTSFLMHRFNFRGGHSYAPSKLS